jgi:Acetyltransferase (GNAT) family
MAPVTVAPAALELAENSNAFTPLGLGEQRLEDPRFVVYLGKSRSPWSTVVQRFRLRAEEVESAVRDLREQLVALGRTSSTWEVGNSATPSDLCARLEALGMVPDREPFAVGMVLSEAPPPPAPGLQAGPVETLEDYRTALAIMHEAFDAPAEVRRREAVRIAETWAQVEASPRMRYYVARLDGVPVGAATASFADAGVVLNAGSTLPEARGRGAYRALVAARWRDAVEHGTPVLITQAGALSRPILTRLGFREVAEIRIFLDEPSG